ncbi:hypothetical protein [Sinimarinibacterium flocculans]|uniref:hypothetical protein n=1 Tax=Sinimarinibacterium flocculans TaxID=985250 RepID=UPI002491F7AA|nr:hypothetical protein [Sinimarinibacterium flocculans]
MSLITGPRVLVAVLALCYAGFLAWYDADAEVLDAADLDAYFAQIRERAGTAEGEGHGQARLFEELRRLAENDDGDEFYMLNLIDFREQAQYPPGAGYGGSALDADARYNRAIVPVLLAHGGHPLFLATPTGRFLDEPGDHTSWERVALVRYRSRRDLVEMVVDLAGAGVGIHKWAAIEKTQVFPTRPVFSLFFVRMPVAVLLIALGGLLHRLLRRQPWYDGARS